MLDFTHEPDRLSWVASANGHAEFPIQNLPFGVFSPPGGDPRGGVAIGDAIIDLGALAAEDLLPAVASAAAHGAAAPTLNAFLALGRGPRTALRQALVQMLDAAGPRAARASAAAARFLHPADECVLHLPVHVGDFTDFYAGIHHATNVGRLLRSDPPLAPNYKHVPLAYHARSSTVVVSGTPIRRPLGQRNKVATETPLFAPSTRLDYELELAVWIGGGNGFGEPVPIAEAADHVGGFGLLNDWSARDIQGWETQPLGPFLGKSFATTVSPWIITPEALAPFRVPQRPRGAGDPAPARYLWAAPDQSAGALAVTIEAALLTPAMAAAGRPPHRLSRSSARDIYWTVAQMVAHHTSNGCNLRAGDLFGSGTISGPEPANWGSLLELTHGNREPIVLPGGETRTFLEDGDTVVFTGRAERDGYATIGFGECRGTILAAPAPA